ncbi:sodium/hydrogen exchanger [Leptolyngbya boryana NIES-2135]|uniref:Sodium/hydrogen exchanger n=1 Tax=Leptolyngbya boryana NIES-2135 TaxID=1973484 RepID=A0A1Z4JID5_LEPBY|nr:cation:proton antiporter [Leptolyngbya boryana]MBD2369798.1 cation:proton antiporter [Leptolyngbya sp. FACHB-161]MBD2376257.1 cation:proton antiporter [Leptolyngbya sp. FACHB-238]MBD2400532.1 cation:proton antiporter [Leptolyngbya sp. FACHB-239]MBD2407074.1 cation:proton antiporter [Leptolyngbya sp. FACHB-402]BAY56491.1 sodium/hydrogen exchanger [Leptolyngbya boryana NIES-2135]
MQEDFRLIVDLVSVLAAAAAGGLFAALLKQPVLLGYLAAGVIVGPTGLGLIKEIIQVETLAQFGVAFLLFALGVEFSFSELKKVKVISLGGGGLQIALTILVTTLVSLAMGWVTSPPQGVFLGGILSLSSTAVVLKCLMERNETSTPHGQVMLGILVVQDLALGLMLAVLPALDQPAEEVGLAIGWALLQTGLFALGAVAAGIWVIPRLLRLLAKTESRELFLLGVVALCLGIALLTEHLGLSIEMGAFVAGLMISDAEYADQTLTYVEPLRDIFASLFFASIGMLIDPVFLWNNLELILGLVTLVFIGKFLIVTPLVRIFRYPLKTALIAGLGLAQIGEFSFVLASEGQTLGLVSRRVYLLILGTTAVTLVVTPFVLRLVPKLFAWGESIPWLAKFLEQSDEPLAISEDLPIKDHFIVCGYGRIGRNIVRLLRDRNHPVLVIDQSESQIQKVRDAGIPYIYGNAASSYVLEKAGVAEAKGMAIALPDPMSTRLCVKRSLEISPDLDLVVRANKDKDIELLYQLGAREVVQPEFETSLELSAHLLAGIGIPSPAVQREVQMIRNSHYLEFRPDQASEEISRDLKAVTGEMNSRWYALPEESPLLGMSIEETDIRRLTGVSVMAIRRAGGLTIDYPESLTTLEQGDRLLIVGETDEVAAFDQLARGEAAVPSTNSSCQWLQVPSESPLIGKTLLELELQQRYKITIQTIRRDGKLIRFPEPDAEIQNGDRLLLCGGFHALTQAQEALSPKTEVPLITTSIAEAES